MELKQLFIGITVVIVGMLAITTWINGLNTAYTTTDSAGAQMGSTFNNSLKTAALINNITSTGKELGNNTVGQEGAGETSQTDGLIKKSTSAFVTTYRLFGIIPSMFNDANQVLKIPEPYIDIARAIFIVSLALTIAYLFLLGVKKITG